MQFDFEKIEEEIKQFWKEQDVYRVELDASKPKYYVLDMFPYPSGAGLHVGHPLGYIGSDIYARYKRLKGFNVLHPMGYDSFGLPAEQYAIQTGQHPKITTEKNIETFRGQLDKLGLSFDWSREVRTSDPEFYKWTQWIFIKLFHSWYNKKTDKAEPIAALILEFEQNGNKNIDAAHGDTFPFGEVRDGAFSAGEWKNFSEKEKSDVLLNYRLSYLADSWVNWCPALGTVLANDEVKDGVSERGGYPVERKLMKQWSQRITAYAERLLQGLETIDWSVSLKEMQENWIGRSEGCSVRFQVSGFSDKVEVFTTRPDTIFGSTFITLAPEHELVEKITTPEYKKQVDEYIMYAKNRSERDRISEVKKVTGQFTGAFAIHPFTQKQIPIWIGEYVLATYGTGAVMGVPGHDERDHRFASHFGLPIVSILEGVDVSEKSFDDKDGIVCNSDFLNGLSVPDAIEKAIDEIERKGIGKRKVNYKLRDAIFGRQRYWGEPIPIYYDEEGIPHTVDEKDLPVVLPEVDKYLPTENGEPPLARAKNWTYSPTNLPEGEASLAQSAQDSDEIKFETADKLNWGKLKENSRANRKNPTEAESILWQHLRNHQLGEHFRRQHAIENFIVDFVCLKKKLIVEVDGAIHDQQIEGDKAREEELQNLGFRILRFKNEDVIHDIDGALEKIKNALEQHISDSVALRESKSPPRGDLEGRDQLRESKSALREDLEGRDRLGESKVSPSGRFRGAFPLELTTMPGWAGSSWYYLRYEDPHNKKEFASKESIDYWGNVDLYVGGDEHAVGHLLYFRFWTKFLFDRGWIPFDEPAKKLVNQGKIQGLSAKALKTGLKTGIDFKFQREFKGRGFLYKDAFGQIQEISFDDVKEDYERNAGLANAVMIYFSPNEFLNEAYMLDNYLSTTVSKNFPIEFVKNGELDVEAYLNSPIGQNDKYSIFITPGGFWFNGRFNPKNESGQKKLPIFSEVEKMSKSKYNVVNPDEVVSKYGADCFRLYEMFLGPIEQHKPWDTHGIDGCFRFLKKFWKLFYDENGNWVVNEEVPSQEELKFLHRTIKKVGEDIEALSHNTAVSAFMICVNELSQLNCHKKQILEPLLIALSPLAPFITEKLWQQLGHSESIVKASFPDYDESLLVENSFEYPVAVNGKTRVKMNFALDLPNEQIEKEVITAEQLQKYFEGKQPKKVIVVKGRMINVVV